MRPSDPATMHDSSGSDETLFAAALQRPSPEARARFLDQACNADPAQRARIEALLKAHEDADTFLASPLTSPTPPLAFEAPGARVGRYKLLQEIGEGGCGTVFMAEQEEPVRRKVALKVVKLGMDTRAVVARFEAERQALALMDNPTLPASSTPAPPPRAGPSS